MTLLEAFHSLDCKDKQHAYVKSYGYTERGLIPHFEPFSNLRTIEFIINWDVNQCEDGSFDEDLWLENKTFWFGNNESRLEDFTIEDGKITIFDPEISARASY